MIRKLRHTFCAIAVSAVLCADERAFEIDHFWRVADDIGFELQPPTFDRYPGSSLFDPPRAAFAEARRIHVQRIYAAFFECGLRMNRDDQLKFFRSRRSQRLHRIEILGEPFFEQ